MATSSAAAMVVGGGIAGMRAALDLADAGIRVHLVEHAPCLGGRVAQLGFMFPQHDCVLCRGTPDHGHGCTRPSISPAYNSQNQHPNIEVLTNTAVVDIAGQAGDFTVSIRQEPRYVNPQLCINCDYCAQVCPVELPDTYQRGLTNRKAAYKVASRAVPDAYVIDRGPYCDQCSKCVDVCPTGAIDLDEQPRLRSLHVGAIILALGFKTFDPTPLEELGYGRFENVIDAMQYERIASRSGPTEGIVVRPSDGTRPRSIAWLQCIGSRDQQNSFCSSICCMYATKEAMLAKQRLGDETDCTVFIMDERAFNKEYSTYFASAREKHGVRYVRSRISNIHNDPHTGDLILKYAHANGELHEERFEMVVLATGLQPPDSARHFQQLLDLNLNEYGFCETHKFSPLQTTHSGVFVCGAFSSPKEISETILDASGAAAEVMRLLNARLNAHPFSNEHPFLFTDEMPPERDVSEEAPRTGLFVCTCGETISKALDLPSLANEAGKLPGVISAELIDLACLPDRIAHIQNRVISERLNRIVIAGCSNRTHESLFQRAVRQAGLNPYFLELVNLRDQCSRVHLHQEEMANRKATEMVRLAIGRVQAAVPVHKIPYVTSGSALVIGGGLAGMTAALAIADSGYEVHLVERTDTLGGHLQELYYVAEGENPRRMGRDLVNRVRAHKLINVYTKTQVVGFGGHAGQFWADLQYNGTVEGTVTRIQHGATIVATGGKEAREHPWLALPGVITMEELEEAVVHHPERIAALRDVVMIQCVQPEGMPAYCSRVCCTNTMKNAIRLKLFNPDCRVTVLYKNIVTYGFREKYYTEARKLGVIFLRYEDEKPPEIIQHSEGEQSVRVYDLSLNRWLILPADVVPLSMPIAPADGTKVVAEMLHVPLSTEGFFAEAQIKLRPMDFMREGIFLAGMAHYPKFIEETISHALAAAGRALTLLAQGTLFLGGVVAEVDHDRCVGCLTCARVCPFGIPEIIDRPGRAGVGSLGGAAFIDPAQCQGCGTCTADCPANAIQLVNYTDRQMMLKEINGLGSWLKSGQLAN